MTHRFDAVIVGGGPRGVATVLRLAARNRDGDPVRIAIVDDVEVGAGATWRTDQPSTYLNNTTAAATTIHPDDSTRMSGPAAPGPDLLGWAADVAAAGAHPLGAWVVEEAAALTGPDFPSRRLQGAYFRDQLEVAVAGGRVALTAVRGLAVDLDRDGLDAVVLLADGRRLTAPTVVLAQGMVQALPTAEVARLEAFAAEHGLLYLAPGMPAEQDWDAVPDGGTVLVRGLGANFFDIVGRLAERWGGAFEAVPDDPHGRLRYRPSGREPRLVAGSHRGLPYRAKPDGHRSAPEAQPRSATRSWFAAQRERRGLDLRRHVWPVVARDLADAHLDALERLDPRLVAEGWRTALDAADDLDAVERVLESSVADDRHRFLIDELRRPTRGRAVEPRHWAELVQRHIDDDLRSMADPAGSPRAAVNRMMNALRGQVVQLALSGAIEGSSVVDDVYGWFDGDGLFLASGPPAERSRRVHALIEAGVIDLIGPAMTVGTIPDRGVFVAESPISGRRVEAMVLAESRMSKGKVPSTSDPLLRSLLDSGRARIHRIDGAESHSMEASPGPVDEAEPHGLNLVDARGRADEAVVVLGIPAATTQPGSAIGASPNKASPLLAGADIAAKQILRRR